MLILLTLMLQVILSSFQAVSSIDIFLLVNEEGMIVSGVGKISWRRERLPTSVFWPGELHGLCNLWGRKGSDTNEQLSLSKSQKWKLSIHGKMSVR